MASHINLSIGEQYNSDATAVGETTDSTPKADPIKTESVSIKKSTMPFFVRLGKTSSEFFKNHTTDLKYLLLVIPIIATFFFVREVQRNQSLRTKASGTILSLSTNNSNPEPGQTFVVAASINTNGLSVSGTSVEISYDPALVTLNTVTAGDFLPVVLMPGNTGVDKASITVGSSPDAPKSGTGVLATFTFTAKTNGVTSISFTPNTKTSAIGQSSNVAEGLAPVSINIGASQTASPTPVSTSTVTPTPTPVVTPTPTPVSACLPQGTTCTGPADTRCCTPWGCDLVPKSGGKYKCGVPVE